MKAFLIKALFWLFVISFFSCEKEEVKKTIAERTIVVYIMGQNNLVRYLEEDIKEMEIGFSAIPENNNLILFIDDYKLPRIIKLEKNKSGEIERKTVLDYEEDVISVDPAIMKNVLSTIFNNFPAESYGLVLWSHADGWLPSNREKASLRWLGVDDGNYGAKMELHELVSVLKSFPKFEFIFFDMCFMQSIEVAYELRHYTKYCIGSPTETPGDGAPYHLILEPMFRKEVNVRKIIENYHSYYSEEYSWYPKDKEVGAAISAINCDELETLAKESREILMKNYNSWQETYLQTIQRYDMRSTCLYYDLNSFFKSFTAEEDYKDWSRQLHKTIPYKETSSKCYSFHLTGAFPIDKEEYSGVATYIIQKGGEYDFINSYYAQLEWYKAVGWDQIYGDFPR